MISTFQAFALSGRLTPMRRTSSSRSVVTRSLIALLQPHTQHSGATVSCVGPNQRHRETYLGGIFRGSVGCCPREALQYLSPALAHLLTEPLGRGTEPFQVAVLEVDLGSLGSERSERNLHFGRTCGVVFELRVELPAEDETPRWIPGQHLAPIAAVFAHFIPAPVRSRLNDAILERGAADMVLLRPPSTHVLGEDAIGTLCRRLDDQLLANGEVSRIAHESISRSTAALNAASA